MDNLVQRANLGMKEGRQLGILFAMGQGVGEGIFKDGNSRRA